jgi:hypothetical protein
VWAFVRLLGIFEPMGEAISAIAYDRDERKASISIHLSFVNSQLKQYNYTRD